MAVSLPRTNPFVPPSIIREASRKATSPYELTENDSEMKGLARSLMVAFFVLVCTSFFLRGIEYYLQPLPRIISLPPETASEGKARILPDLFRLPSADIPSSVKEHIAKAGRWVLGIENVQAAEFDYAAQKYSKIKEIEMVAGERKEIKVGFDNKGHYNWRRDGSNFISIYTDKPHYRSSVFWDKSWYQKDQPAKLKDSIVGPGKRGYFEFYLQAPKEPGVYKENFALAAENKSWLPGGQFELIITVRAAEQDNGEEKNISETEISTQSKIAETLQLKKLNSTDYKARRLSRLDPLILTAGEKASLTLMFLNQGKKSWQKRQIIFNQAKTSIVFDQGEVKPGQTEIYTIPLPALTGPGIYNFHFDLLINEGLISGGSLDIPLMVVAEGENKDVAAAALEKALEPSIRIGLFTTEEPVLFKSPFVYQIKNDQGGEWGTINPNEEASISFDENTELYVCQTAAAVVTSTQPWRLESNDANSYFIIANYENRPNWNKKLNDNKFRGALELYFSPTGYLWVINELPIEDYLKGLAEASENSPAEFQKALLTAARSYAFYHLKNPTKHEKGNFVLDAEVDQVYRGYAQEERSPKLVAAVEATRGLIVTYQGEAVPTPYFSRSNGRTRTWKEVWGGTDKPWLKSVKTPYDKGYSRLGHGVGMSLHDATYRAKKGAFYEEILKYYYKGVELMRAY